ncbi:uncharacterized protein LOC111696454 isoform X1 [Eurytemora carolleeae]|uniref:uncharacterized protein LOC111696454 isoform X1 n=1 Tax=Eurytemora carolleeae TaxID=1294199 RepID=UPI000C789904|nr:uncharacterized protein LOC111696454 isoform X1 [Eurytemora carolleeae]|eukprot:XP_023321826.1 uncharacterized protein LOC111696454 isoform X1 [Eurytemora affinis]
MSDLIVLNAVEVGSTEPTETIEQIIKDMRIKITTLKGKFMKADGSSVNYKDMGSSLEFKEYIRTCNQLTIVHLEQLTQAELKCLFLNLYNSLTVHALVYQNSKGTLPASPKDVDGFWRIHCYKIGNGVYSLDDMEHGVLRANKGHPSNGAPQFSDTDIRSKCVVQILDPRIHFAINCGALSCPPIRIYTVDRLDDQLEIATTSFLSQEVVVKTAGVEVSKLLLWYVKNFISSIHQVVVKTAGLEVSKLLLWYGKYLNSSFHQVVVKTAGMEVSKLLLWYGKYLNSSIH